MAEGNQGTQQTENQTPQNQTQQTQGEQNQTSQGIQRSSNQSGSMTARRGFPSSIFSMNPFSMMAMSPFQLMRQFTEEMDRMFDDFGFGTSGNLPAQGQQGGTALQRGGATGLGNFGGTLFSPQVEVFEREGQLVVRADLPGMNKEDVRVEVTDDGLLVEGERRFEHQENQGGVYRSERSYGTFRRLIPLPEGVNVENANASFKNGVLEITMQAPQQQQGRRRIEIQSESGTSSSQGQAAESSSAASPEQSQAASGS